MLWRDLKRYAVGDPMGTERLSHERIPKVKALAVFSSDALSSVAYATEEILRVLMLVGMSAMNYYTMPISLAIIALLVIVTISYRQTIFAYPSGGGAYIVGKDNLGQYAGLIAAAALMIDYVLTVSVSVAAGVAAITSALPATRPLTIPMCILCVLIIMSVNLRGIRESATIFALPTYAFIFSIYLLIAVGFVEILMGYGVDAAHLHPLPDGAGGQALSLYIILRAFSGGCTAMTGVEAISNGVQAFRKPEDKNANTTMAWMSFVLGSMFLGITILTNHFPNVPNDDETVISQLAHAVLGGGILYYFLQAATALILILAANTSYSDFPRLSSLIAKDGYLPRQMAALGDRLVFSNGIVILSALAIALLVWFKGDTDALIPLYAVGVFVSFTISQWGMVRYWFKHPEGR